MNRKKALAILGLPAGATADEIRLAYRRMAMKYHPDRNQKNGAVAEASFKEAKAAYEFLGKKPPREEFYEHSSTDPRNFEDLFGSIFGQTLPLFTVTISLRNALEGGRVEIDTREWGGAESVHVNFPKGVGHGAEFLIEALGRKKRMRVLLDLPKDWIAEERLLIVPRSFTLLDQLLGGLFEVELPLGSKVRCKLCPMMSSDSVIMLNCPDYKPYKLGVRVDFSKKLELNDTELDQLSFIRSKVRERERLNGT